jgi:hypothetical protein
MARYMLHLRPNRRRGEADLPDVPNHAYQFAGDILQPVPSLIEGDALPHPKPRQLLARVAQPRHRFIDDRHRGAGLVVLSVEATAPNHGNSHGAEVVRTHDPDLRAPRALVIREVATRGEGTVVGPDELAVLLRAHGEDVGGSGGADAGQRAHSVEDILVEAGDLGRLRVIPGPGSEVERQHVLRPKAGIDPVHLPETFQQEPRPSQQDQRQSDLRHHQTTTQLLPPPVAGAAPTPDLKGGGELRPEGLVRGGEPEDRRG